MKGKTLIGGVILVSLLSACGGAETRHTDVAQATSTAEATAATTVASTKPAESKDAIRVIESGFGVSNGYAWVTALVHNEGAKPGDFVVGSFNLKDAAGQVFKTETHTEQFYKAGQDLALGTQVQIPEGKEIATVDVTVKISNNLPEDPTPELIVGEVTVVPDYGSLNAQFQVTNSGEQVVENPRFGVICKDSSGVINGGGGTYPEMVPPSGVIMAEAFLIVTEEPATCQAYYAGTSF